MACVRDGLLSLKGLGLREVGGVGRRGGRGMRWVKMGRAACGKMAEGLTGEVRDGRRVELEVGEGRNGGRWEGSGLGEGGVDRSKGGWEVGDG